MNEKRKILLIALLISAIITAVITGLIYMNTRQTELPEPQAFLMAGIVEDAFGPYVPYWMLGLISIICFVALTLVFYLIVCKLKQTKK
jgi:hypothetical protein